MQNYNPEQIMLSAVARRSSRDVNIMKERLIFSGGGLTTFTPGNGVSQVVNRKSKHLEHPCVNTVMSLFLHLSCNLPNQLL